MAQSDGSSSSAHPAARSSISRAGEAERGEQGQRHGDARPAPGLASPGRRGRLPARSEARPAQPRRAMPTSRHPPRAVRLELAEGVGPVSPSFPTDSQERTSTAPCRPPRPGPDPDLALDGAPAPGGCTPARRRATERSGPGRWCGFARAAPAAGSRHAPALPGAPARPRSTDHPQLGLVERAHHSARRRHLSRRQPSRPSSRSHRPVSLPAGADGLPRPRCSGRTDRGAARRAARAGLPSSRRRRTPPTAASTERPAEHRTQPASPRRAPPPGPRRGAARRAPAAGRPRGATTGTCRWTAVAPDGEQRARRPQTQRRSEDGGQRGRQARSRRGKSGNPPCHASPGR